mmetsp:Transcript_30868/g.98538  ORF Transcript_30868/g.98538 Transcript_30868/m.98538 type:complete len:230 (+) Transcript_30868:1-690(+)
MNHASGTLEEAEGGGFGCYGRPKRSRFCGMSPFRQETSPPPLWLMHRHLLLHGLPAARPLPASLLRRPTRARAASITMASRSDKPAPAPAPDRAGFAPDVTLEQLRQDVGAFAEERDWDQFHTPRNLLLALVGEVGELSEIFQWKGEVKDGLPGWSEEEKEHLGEELSDVLLYLVRLADKSGIDLPKAAGRKLKKNAAKYPADKCRGKSAKYTAYQSPRGGDSSERQGE